MLKRPPVTVIQKAREAKRWSQRAFAIYLGVNNSSVSFWEARKRRPRDSTIRLMALLLGIEANSIRADYPNAIGAPK